MAKKLLQRFLPDPEWIRNHKNLKIFGDKITDPNIWHINRRSISKAVAIGLFISFIPAPGHMLCAAFIALLWRANLPVSVILVWVSNPITIPPMYYFGYKVGAYLLGIKAQHLQFEMSADWMMKELGAIAEPLYLGCIICGLIFGFLGYFATRVFWRFSVARAWRLRKESRRVGSAESTP